ncbi:MAG TPA: phage baseplate assembly protein V [Kofleriaceae bacterium]|nr:phage baseplate assembly protein V [Kofleriaceae bacterium]
MSALLSTMRALIRAELARTRAPALGTVTQVYPRASSGDKENHQVDVKLLDSAVELPRVPVAVPRIGWSALPEVDDLVVVVFVGGDLNAPIVVGCVYDDQAHPPVAKAHEVVYQPPEDEDASVRRLHVELKNGGKLTLDEDKLTIELGDTSVVVNRDGDLTIKAKGKIHLESDSDIEIVAGGDLKLEAQGSATAKGMSVTVEGQSAAKVKGAQVTLAGITQFSSS